MTLVRSDLESLPVPCACGCGISPKRGRFMPGHYQRTIQRREGYAQLFNGGVIRKAHQIRAEKALGRVLPSNAQVHHVDGRTTDRDAPLVICENASYHMLLHARQRIQRAGGDPNTDKICSHCGLVKQIVEFYVGSHRCKPCAIIQSTEMKRRRQNAHRTSA